MTRKRKSEKYPLGGVSQAIPDSIMGKFVVIVMRFMVLVLFVLLVNIIVGK